MCHMLHGQLSSHSCCHCSFTGLWSWRDFWILKDFSTKTLAPHHGGSNFVVHSRGKSWREVNLAYGRGPPADMPCNSLVHLSPTGLPQISSAEVVPGQVLHRRGRMFRDTVDATRQ